jgi:hypothetical protein
MSTSHPSAGRLCRFGRLGALLAALLFAAGCVEFDQTIVIDKSGSAVFTLSYSFDDTLMATFTSAQRVIEGWQKGQPLPAGDPLFWLTSEEAAKTYFSGNGISLQKYRNQVREGRRLVHVTCAAKEVRAALATGKFGRFKLDRNEYGNYQLTADWAAESEPAEVPEEQVKRLRTLCRGMKLGLAIQTPTNILATSGEKVRENAVLWRFDLERDDSFLRQLPPIRVVFRNRDLDWDPPSAAAAAPEAPAKAE